VFLVLVGMSLVLRSWYGLELEPYWDEKFTLENAHALVGNGTVEPVYGYYSLFSYLPQAAIVAAIQWLSESPLEPYVWPPTASAMLAFQIGRLLQVALGGFALGVLYLLGRRLFDERVAMLAVLATSYSQFVTWAWAHLKPDALVSLFALIGLLAALRAFDRPTPGRYFVAGLGIAFAMSSKMPGGLIAVSLVFGAVVALGWGRAVGLLSLAAGAAGAGFLLLNPYWRINLHYLGVLRAEYAGKAAKAGMGRAEGLREFLSFVVDLLGPVLALLLCLGVLYAVAQLAMRQLTPDRKAGFSALLAFPVAFVAAYFIQTPYFKGNNFASIVPLLFLISVATLVRCWDTLSRTWTGWVKPAAAWTGVVALCTVWVQSGTVSAYNAVVPTTENLARQWLSEHLGRVEGPAGRLVYAERMWSSSPSPDQGPSLGNPSWGITLLERLDDATPQVLDLSDGELFPAGRCHGESAAFYLRRLDGNVQSSRFRPRAFAQRGPDVIVVAHPWQLAEPRRGLDVGLVKQGPPGSIARLPADVGPEDLISLAVWIPFVALDAGGEVSSAEIGSDAVRLHWTGRSGGGHLFLTDRFRPREQAAFITLWRAAEFVTEDAVAMEVYRWREREHPIEP